MATLIKKPVILHCLKCGHTFERVKCVKACTYCEIGWDHCKNGKHVEFCDNYLRK